MLQDTELSVYHSGCRRGAKVPGQTKTVLFHQGVNFAWGRGKVGLMVASLYFGVGWNYCGGVVHFIRLGVFSGGLEDWIPLDC